MPKASTYGTTTPTDDDYFLGTDGPGGSPKRTKNFPGARVVDYLAGSFPLLNAQGVVSSAATGLVYPAHSFAGITGDGVTDNTTAINNAMAGIAAFGGGILYFQPGIYKISSQSFAARLIGRSKVHIKGSGIGVTTFKVSDNSVGAHGIILTDCDDVTLEDFTIDGSNAIGADHAGHNITVSGGSRITIRNVRSIFSPNYGISMQECSDYLIENCFVEDAGDVGIDTHNIGLGLSGGRISNCIIRRHGFNNTGSDWGINVRGPIVITNCQVLQVGYYNSGPTSQPIAGIYVRFGEDTDLPPPSNAGGTGGQFSVISNCRVEGDRSGGKSATVGNMNQLYGAANVGVVLEAHDVHLSNVIVKNLPIGFQTVQADCTFENCHAVDVGILGWDLPAGSAPTSGLPKWGSDRTTLVGCTVMSSEVYTGTAQAKPASSKITLDATMLAYPSPAFTWAPPYPTVLPNTTSTGTGKNNYLADQWLQITSGTGAGTGAFITKWDPATNQATLSANLSCDATSVYRIGWAPTGFQTNATYVIFTGCSVNGTSFTVAPASTTYGLRFLSSSDHCTWLGGYVQNTASGISQDAGTNNIFADANTATFRSAMAGTYTYAAQAANTVLANATNGSASPTAVALGASTMLARLASGNIVAATVTQIKTLLAYAAGDLSAIAANTFLGNNTSSSAAPVAFTVTQAKALLAYAIGDLANIAATTIVGNSSGSSGVPTALTASTARSVLKLASTVKVGTTVNSNNGSLATMLPSTFSLPASPVVGDITKFTGLISAVAGGGTGTFSYQITVAGTAVLATVATSSVTSGATILGELDFYVGVLTLGSGTSGKLNIWGHILWNNGDRMYVMSENLGVDTTATIAVDIKASASVNNAFTATVCKQFWMLPLGGT